AQNEDIKFQYGASTEDFSLSMQYLGIGVLLVLVVIFIIVALLSKEDSEQHESDANDIAVSKLFLGFQISAPLAMEKPVRLQTKRRVLPKNVTSPNEGQERNEQGLATGAFEGKAYLRELDR